MPKTVVSLSYAQALRAMKRDECDLIPCGDGWCPRTRKWFVSGKNVERMVEHGAVGYCYWEERSDGKMYAMRVTLLSRNNQNEKD